MTLVNTETGEIADTPTYGEVHSRYLDRADANLAQAEKVRRFCLEQHGVDLGEKATA